MRRNKKFTVSIVVSLQAPLLAWQNICTERTDKHSQREAEHRSLAEKSALVHAYLLGVVPRPVDGDKDLVDLGVPTPEQNKTPDLDVLGRKISLPSILSLADLARQRGQPLTGEPYTVNHLRVAS